MLSVNFSSKLSLCIPLLLVLFISACSPQDNQETAKQSRAFIEDKTLCNFKESSCEKQVAGINLTLSITPFNTPSEKPLTLEVTSNESLSALTMRIEGRDMFMGVIPVNLAKTNENQYNGQLIFGSCSSNYMVWRAFITFEKNGTQHVTIFDFLADSDKH